MIVIVIGIKFIIMGQQLVMFVVTMSMSLEVIVLMMLHHLQLVNKK